MSTPPAQFAISIHALVKRATEGDDWKHPYDIISIHALVKRATYTNKYTAKRGFISIHALVKRATNERQETPKGTSHFNPRPRKEGDLHCMVSGGR